MMDNAPMRVLFALALVVYLVLRGCMSVLWGLCTLWRWFPRRDFEPGDSARPYVKFTYESRDGWGSRSGFLARRGLPKGIRVQPVHPDYDATLAAALHTAPFASLIWEPGVPHWVWWRANCRMHLAEQRRYEALARVDHAPERE
jgi:hypothetical protein